MSDGTQQLQSIDRICYLCQLTLVTFCLPMQPDSPEGGSSGTLQKGRLDTLVLTSVLRTPT